MKVYVTFGQIHAHSVNGKTFDKDSVAVITVNDYADGRKQAFELFGQKFCFVTEKQPNMVFSPRGLIYV